MNTPHNQRADGDGSRPGGPYRRLEQLTAVVLSLVVAAVIWMLAAARWPERFRLASESLEVAVVLILLTAALGLVSLVSLLHTRGRN